MLTNPSNITDGSVLFKQYGDHIEYQSPKHKKAFKLACLQPTMGRNDIAAAVQLSERTVTRALEVSVARCKQYYLLHKPSVAMQVSAMQKLLHS